MNGAENALAEAVVPTPRAVPGAGVPAERILAETRELTRPALRQAVADCPESCARPVGLAVGLLDGDGNPVDGGGKMFRAALALAAALGYRDDPRPGVAGAVAVELLHAYTLTHDDVMDGDRWRRGQPSVWAAHGLNVAILTGDVLYALAQHTLAQHTLARRDAAGGAAAARYLSRAAVDVTYGQAQDLAMEPRPFLGPEAVSVDEYREMTANKTGSVIGAALAIGGALGGAGAEQTDALWQAGRHLGVAFQAVDDQLGIWGEPSVTGKPVDSDLARRKKTIPVLAAVGSRPELAEAIERFQPAGLPELARALADAGGHAAARDEAAAQLDQARRMLDRAAPRPAARARLDALIDFTAARTA
ncbi:geranylgeranyl diphosphate synthase type I [Pseudonocardia eucalypti]|nr:geranylgeranyl diphosphate synthase type I [Pseudonocardia eucalypti]